MIRDWFLSNFEAMVILIFKSSILFRSTMSNRLLDRNFLEDQLHLLGLPVLLLLITQQLLPFHTQIHQGLVQP